MALMSMPPSRFTPPLIPELIGAHIVALENDSPTESGSISRRTIVKGAAWAAPVMIAAVAVPAAVASTATKVAPPQVLSLTELTQLTFTLNSVPTQATVTVAISGAGWKLGQNSPRKTETVVATSGGQFTVWVEPGGADSATLSVSGAAPDAWGPFTSTLKKTAV